jgi:hypothetical protein
MTTVTVLNLSTRPRRIDPIAATWGGLVLGIGLVIAGPRDLAVRIAIVVIVGVIAGFLTGVRAIRHRLANAAMAWVVANLFYFAFVAAASIVHWITGRQHAPAFLPGGPQRWLLVTLVSLVATLVGGGIANALLRPASRRSNYS